MGVQVVAPHALQVGHIADDFVMIAVHAEGRRADGLAELKERLILAALPLGDDHRALGFDLLLGEGAVDHAVGLQAQGQVNFIGRHGLEVRRPVHVGEGVPMATLARDGFVQHVGGELGCALELHVLHPVRDAGDAGDFIARADAIPHPVADDRRGVDLLQHHLQAVGKLCLRDGFGHARYCFPLFG